MAGPAPETAFASGLAAGCVPSVRRSQAAHLAASSSCTSLTVRGGVDGAAAPGVVEAWRLWRLPFF